MAKSDGHTVAMIRRLWGETISRISVRSRECYAESRAVCLVGRVGNDAEDSDHDQQQPDEGELYPGCEFKICGRRLK